MPGSNRVYRGRPCCCRVTAVLLPVSTGVCRVAAGGLPGFSVLLPGSTGVSRVSAGVYRVDTVLLPGYAVFMPGRWRPSTVEPILE